MEGGPRGRSPGGVRTQIRRTIGRTPAAAAGRQELNDGLTPEQRKMLDDLGKS